MKLTSAALLCVVILLPATGHAQSIEAGPSLAVACRGSEGSSCGGGSSASWGGYVSLVATDTVETGFLLTRMAGGNRSIDVGSPPFTRAEILITDRSRIFFLGQVLYHFKRGDRVRPLVGGAFGRFIDARTTTCRPLTCEDLRPLAVDAGRNTAVHTDVAVVAGLSVNVAPPIRIRTGVRIHNFAAESQSTSELFVEAGYRIR